MSSASERVCRSWPVTIPKARSRAAVAGPTPWNFSIGRAAEKGQGALGTDDRQTVRLAQVRGDLGEELVERDAGGGRQAGTSRGSRA